MSDHHYNIAFTTSWGNPYPPARQRHDGVFYSFYTMSLYGKPILEFDMDLSHIPKFRAQFNRWRSCATDDLPEPYLAEGQLTYDEFVYIMLTGLWERWYALFRWKNYYGPRVSFAAYLKLATKWAGWDYFNDSRLIYNSENIVRLVRYAEKYPVGALRRVRRIGK